MPSSQDSHFRRSTGMQVDAISSGAELSLACFEAAGQTYAVEVAHVREIVRRPAITPLPNAPALIEGVVELRENVIPVIDLARALGHEPMEPTDRSRVAVVELDEMVFGLCVDAASDVLAVAPSDLHDPPPLATQAGYEAVKAIVRRPDSPPVMLLALEQILESVYRSALPRQEES